MPGADASFRGQLVIVRMKRRSPVLPGECCTRCMLYSVYAVLSVCDAQCMLHSVYVVFSVNS